jgi:hypothetical protein
LIEEKNKRDEEEREKKAFLMAQQSAEKVMSQDNITHTTMIQA